MRRTGLYAVAIAAILLISGCMSPNIKLFTDATDPLKECVIEGSEAGKVVVIPVYGVISDIPKKGIIRDQPSMVQNIISQLKLAEADPEVKAVLFKIDSPGGSVTASDILYHEINAFKERTGIKVVSIFMNVAASGGYYMALASDYIMAHPTTLTGSVGVIFLQPKLYELMNKIGVGVTATTSGENKDMGSPFRKTTATEEKIFQSLTDTLGKRFVDLVVENRKIGPEAIKDISSARIYLSEEALSLGLIDKIGYIGEAVTRTKELAGLDKDSRVIVYRRNKYPDDNLYNIQSGYGGRTPQLVNLGLPDSGMMNRCGFYYLWPAGIEGK